MRLATICCPSTHALLRAAVAGRTAVLLGTVGILTQDRSPTGEPDVLVVDAVCLGPPALRRAVQQYLARHPTVGVLAVGPLSRQTAQAVSTVDEMRRTEVVLTDYDPPSVVWTYVRRAYLQVIPIQVALRVRACLPGVPPTVLDAVHHALVGSSAPMRNMGDLADVSGYSLRSVYRLLTGAGISHPKEILRIGRLIQGLPLLYELSHRLPDVASMMGMRDYFEFQRFFKRVMGVTPRAFRHAGDPGDVVERAVADLFAPAVLTGTSGQPHRTLVKAGVTSRDPCGDSA
jgi:AraC-like DNA-binding protein